ncbi:MAG: asparagine synthase (glutamine-hydrolyzing) [Dehalococcoidia bacterium]|nr:asparagine synthase (glutamine-hydrolyzing) [Dehalococcoidia bacterium]
MCGIAGIVHFDGRSPSSETVEGMIRLLAHRGPDGERTWSCPEAALGHARLRIIDLSPASDQPFLSEDGKTALVYNGEVYNYRELRTELASRGHVFRTAGDTEVVLRAYEEWGINCPAHLNGMFAIAIWDGRKRQIFLSRDRFGEKPLFYWTDGRRLIFASEIKSILADKDVGRQPDPANLRRYLSTGDMDIGESTFIAGIAAVPASHSLIWSPDGTRRRARYWSPRRPGHNDGAASGSSHRTEQFRELLEDAVRLRLRSDVNVGTSLSGGLDSSSIIGMVRNLSESEAVPRRTFSARFRDHKFDEGEYIAAATASVPAYAHETWIDADGFLQALPALQWAQEAPFGGTSVYAQWEVMRLAKEHDTIVLLDGQGADELLGGYTTAYGMYWSHLLYRGQLVRLGREVAAYSRRYGFSSVTALYGLYYSIPERLRAALAERYYRATAIMSPDLRHAHRPSGRSPGLPGLQRLHGLLSQQLMTTSLPELLRYADRNSMAFSREVRLPFLDHRLVEFVLGLPAEDLIGGAVTKKILRRAMRGLVPDKILDRRDKVGFAPPQERWLRGPLAGWLNETLGAAEQRTDIFDAEGVRAVRTEFHAGGPDTLAWRIASTETWFQHFLDRRVSPPRA